jgi:signal transduction histidine kinase
VAQLNRRISEAQGIRLTFEVPEEPSEVRLDPDRIEQVLNWDRDEHRQRFRYTVPLNNLIGNAIKFSHAGSTIRLEVTVQSAALRFAVFDEGLGIPREEICNLFQEFRRASTEPTAGEHGAGLGLAICQRIVKRHGGTIGVEREPGRGSRFWFELPVMPAEET